MSTHEAVHQLAGGAANDAVHRAEHNGDEHGQKAHQQGDPSAVEQAGEGVPAEVIRSQQVLGGGGQELLHGLHGDGVVGGQGCQQGGQKDQQQHTAAENHGEGQLMILFHRLSPRMALMRGSARQ